MRFRGDRMLLRSAPGKVVTIRVAASVPQSGQPARRPVTSYRGDCGTLDPEPALRVNSPAHRVTNADPQDAPRISERPSDGQVCAGE